LTEQQDPQTIIGFFTLTLCEVRGGKLPAEIAKKYPDQVPGVKLAHLAVDRQWQRQGIGEILMVYCKQLNIGLRGLEARGHIPDFLEKSGI
jgi:ribosomal protein S18 acetylase RimI-like enzyme